MPNKCLKDKTLDSKGLKRRLSYFFSKMYHNIEIVKKNNLRKAVITPIICTCNVLLQLYNYCVRLSAVLR